MDPLVVEGDCANAQGGPINKVALEDFMATTGHTAEHLMGGASIPTSDYDIYRTYVYGQSLVNPKYYSSLGTQMFLLNKWYLKVTANDKAAWLVAKVRPQHYLGYDVVHIEFNEFHQLLNWDLNKSLVSCWCL
jgi:hypothetical protein